MKKWKAYLCSNWENAQWFYDEFELDVTDEEYLILAQQVDKNKPLNEVSIYPELILRTQSEGIETLKDVFLSVDDEDRELYTEEEIQEMVDENARNIEYGNYQALIDDPKAEKRFHDYFIGRKYEGFDYSTISVNIQLKDPFITKTEIEIAFGENSIIESVSEIRITRKASIIYLSMENVVPFMDYDYLLKAVETILLNRKIDDENGKGKWYYIAKNPEGKYIPEKEVKNSLEEECYDEPAQDFREKSVQTNREKVITNNSEKKEEVIVEKKPEITSVKVENKKETRKSSGLYVVLVALVAIIAALGLYIYNNCFVAKTVMMFDKQQLASYKIDGYYDVFDRSYSSEEDLRQICYQLEYFEYVRVLNPFEKVEDNDQRIGITFYDEKGKKLEEIICYSDDRITINGKLCKPVNMNADMFLFPVHLKADGQIWIRDSLRSDVERMMKNSRFEEGNAIIELIDIPFPEGTYSKIWATVIDDSTGKDKKVAIFDMTKQNYQHLPGYKMALPLEDRAKGRKYKSLWLEISACGVEVVYNITEIIPTELKVENK